MTVQELLSNISARELSEWQAYLNIMNEKQPEKPEVIQEKIKQTFIPMKSKRKKK